MPDRRTVLATLGTASALAVAGCTGGGNGGDNPTVVDTTAVSMANTQFEPRNIRVDTGATVTWTNDDSTPHTVTAASDNWTKDTEVSGSDTTTHTFEESGVYDVYCRFHGSADLSGMSMKVAVGDASIDAPLGGGDSGSGGGGGIY